VVGGGSDPAVITLLVEPGQLATGARLSLPRSEAHHLRVRRTREGDTLRLVDGRGRVATGVAVGDPGEGQAEIRECRDVPAPAPLILAVGSGDKDRFAWLAEKCGELGVTDLIPVETERTHSVGARVRGEHVERLQRCAREAIKQSGAAWAPVVHLPHTLAELVARHPGPVRWLADPDGSVPPAVAPAASILVAVGPEGGFTAAERQQLLQAGFHAVRLGTNTLRFETAAIAAAVVVGALRTGETG
jgi:16S rRNA (uracil1498-N3)-methyltransferase